MSTSDSPPAKPIPDDVRLRKAQPIAKAAAKLLPLTVQAADGGTELFVIDASLRLVAKGQGTLATQLPSGIYTVKAAVGAAKTEQLVLLLEGQPSHIAVDPVPFATAVPLEATSTSHEYHQEFARKLMAGPAIAKGAGGSLMLLARVWTPESRRAAGTASSVKPAAAVRLFGLDGRLIYDFADAAEWVGGPDPCGGGLLDLDPGLYVLQRDTSSGLKLRQTIPVAAGWRTEVYLLRGEAGRPDDLSLYLSRPKEFDPASASARRLSEMARVGLRAGRATFDSASIDKIVCGSSDDPMLGIYGAALLLLPGRETAPEEDLASIVAYLRGVFGNGNPDVEAIALQAGVGTKHVFDAPPSLRRNWQAVLDASVDQPSLVPVSSLAAASAPRIVADEPWLLWTEPSAAAAHEEEGLETLQTPEPDIAAESLLRLLAPARSPSSFSQPMAADAPPKLPTAIDRPALHRLVKSMGLPRAQVESMLLGLKVEVKE